MSKFRCSSFSSSVVSLGHRNADIGTRCSVPYFGLEADVRSTTLNDCIADFPAVRLAPLYGRYLRIAVVGRAPHFASAARSQTLVNGPLRTFSFSARCRSAACRTGHSLHAQSWSCSNSHKKGRSRHLANVRFPEAAFLRVLSLPDRSFEGCWGHPGPSKNRP